MLIDEASYCCTSETIASTFRLSALQQEGGAKLS